MPRFNPDDAIFATLASALANPPSDSTFSYVNNAMQKLFGTDFNGKTVLSLLEELLGINAAEKTFNLLLTTNSIIIEGTLNGRNVQCHAMIDRQKGHLQMSIIDTTASSRAHEGFRYAVNALARAAEVNDEDTGNHITRINSYSAKLAEILAMDQAFIDDLGLLAQLHDVGKIHVDPAILKKPGKLTADEFKIMKLHTVQGAKIIGNQPELALAHEIAIAHHEKFDGNGYPYGLRGEAIPISARIVAIVDVFDALLSKRPYKKAFSYEHTYTLLTKGDDYLTPHNHFDPEILKVFIDHFDDFKQIHTDLK